MQVSSIQHIILVITDTVTDHILQYMFKVEQVPADWLLFVILKTKPDWQMLIPAWAFSVLAWLNNARSHCCVSYCIRRNWRQPSYYLLQPDYPSAPGVKISFDQKVIRKDGILCWDFLSMVLSTHQPTCRTPHYFYFPYTVFTIIIFFIVSFSLPLQFSIVL